MKPGQRVAVVGTRKVGAIVGGANNSVFSKDRLFRVRLDGQERVSYFVGGELRKITEPGAKR